MAAWQKKALQVMDEFRTLAENSPDLIDRFDPNGRHLYVNAAGLRLLGRTARQVIGKTIRETGAPRAFSKRWEARIRRVFRTSKPLAVEDSLDGASGRRFFECCCVPEFGPDGRVRSVLVVSREVTDRKCTEAALQESEARYRILFEQAPDPIVVIDPSTLSFLDCNRATSRFLGYTRKEILSLRLPDMVVGRSAAELRRQVRHILSRREVVFEAKHWLKNGEIRDVQVRPKSVWIGGRTVVQGIWHDVTEHNRRDDELRSYREELERKVRERTARLRSLATMLSQVEHRERRRIADVLHDDMQQRLAGIGYSLAAIGSGLSDRRAAREIERLKKELSEALLLSRRLVSSLCPPALYDAGLRAALESLARDMKKRLGLQIEIRGRQPVGLRSTETRAFAFGAVRELLMNVVKHAGVRTAQVQIRHLTRQRVSIAVVDHGRGFDMSHQPGETGFGLFGIRERAESFGGHFDVSSRPGKGTRVVLILPTDDGAQAPRVGPSQGDGLDRGRSAT